MTTSQSRNLRKAGAVALSLALAMSTLAITPASAAKKVKLAKTKITVNVGKTKTVKIKNIKKKQVKKLTVKSKSTKVAKAKASKKTAIKVTGKKAGSTKVTANLKLKKKVNGKKAYKLTLKVTVKKAAPTPTEAPAPTVAPTAAPTPVISGSSISLDKPAGYACTVSGPSVTMTAKIVPETSNEQVTWKFADPTIAMAVSGSATVNGIATAQLVGLKEGETTVSASIGAMTASAKVTVGKEIIAAKIKEVKQTKADEIEITFLDANAVANDNVGFNKDKFEVTVVGTNKLTTTNFPKKLSPVKDGKATLTLTNGFTDKDAVTVNLYKGTDYATKGEFVASVGEPVSVGITKLQYQKDVEDPVEFALYDSNGIDVTSTKQRELNTLITLSLASDFPGKDIDFDTPTKAKIKMEEVGKTGTVNIEFKKDVNQDEATAKNSAVVTCIAPIPVSGKAHFQDRGVAGKKMWDGTDGEKSDNDNDAPGVAKFYKGDKNDITSLSMYEGDTATVSFYASDDDGNAISYDSYELLSQNGDYVEVSPISGDKAAGKFINIEVKALKKSGSAIKINVTGVKNTAKTVYSFDVNVKEANREIKTIKLKSNRTKVSNSFDSAYQKENELQVNILDKNGVDITEDYNGKIELKATNANDSKKDLQGKLFTTGEAGKDNYKDDRYKHVFTPDASVGNWNSGRKGAFAKFDASGVEPIKYNVVASVGDKKSSAVTIEVADVPTDLYYTAAGSNKTKVKYQVVADETVKLNEDKSGDTGKARLAAYTDATNAVFIGYVDENGDFGQIGDSGWATGAGGANDFVTTGVATPESSTKIATDDATLKSKTNGFVYAQVERGGKFATGGIANGNVPLYNFTNYFTLSTEKFTTGAGFTTSAICYDAVSDTHTYYANKKSDKYAAEAGKKLYTVRFKWAQHDGTNGDIKWHDATAPITVENNLYVPTVTYDTRNVDDFKADTIKEALRTNVDLNCNKSNNLSIVGVFGSWNKTDYDPWKDPADEKIKRQTIGAVTVREGYWTIYVDGSWEMTRP